MRATIVALAVLAALTATTGAAAARKGGKERKEKPVHMPEWAVEAMAGDPAGVFPDADAVVLLDRREIVVEKGRRTGTRRRVVKVVTEDGRAEASMGVYSGTFRKFSKVRAWLRDPGGSVQRFTEEDGTLFSAVDVKLLDDDSYLWIDPPGLRPGSILAVEYRFVVKPDLPQSLFAIQRDIPILNMHVEVSVKDDWQIRARVYGADNPGPEGLTREGTWSFTNVPELPESEARHAPVPPGSRMTLEFIEPGGEPPFPDWNSTALWVGRLFDESRREASPLVDQAASELPSGAGEAELLAAAGELVRRMRYFGIEIGWGGWRPRAPDTTLRRRFGDCKDKSFLMVELLRRGGIEAVPVLIIAPRNGYVYAELPGPFQFNHCIVGIPSRGGERREGTVVVESPGLGALRLFDPTLSDVFPGDVHPYLEGGRGLAIHPGTQALLEVPRSPAAANAERTVFDVELDPAGSLRARIRRTLSGAMVEEILDRNGEVYSRRALRLDGNREWFSDYPGLTGLEIAVLPRPVEGGWVFETRFRQPEALADFGDLRLLRLHDLAGQGIFPLPDEDEPETLHQPHLMQLRETWNLTAAGHRLVKPPADVEIENDLGRVALVFKREGDRLTVERELDILAMEVPPERREDAKALRDAVRAVNSTSLVFDARAAR